MAVTIVVKVGGELLEPGERAQMEAIAQDLATLAQRGDALFVVHGGGPQASALSRRLGLAPAQIAGRRVTDEATLVVMAMAVAGQVSTELCARLVDAGLRPVGLHGASGPVLRARKRPPRVISGGPSEPVDLGWVGDVAGFDLALLERLTESGYTPVLASLGYDPQARCLLNINADIVAAALAVALAAPLLVLVTGAPGVLADTADPESRIERLTAAQARNAAAVGTTSGGMLPKLEESFAALEKGVGEILIVGKLGPGDLLRAIASPGCIGTRLTR